MPAIDRPSKANFKFSRMFPLVFHLKQNQRNTRDFLLHKTLKRSFIIPARVFLVLLLASIRSFWRKSRVLEGFWLVSFLFYDRIKIPEDYKSKSSGANREIDLYEAWRAPDPSIKGLWAQKLPRLDSKWGKPSLIAIFWWVKSAFFWKWESKETQSNRPVLDPFALKPWGPENSESFLLSIWKLLRRS